MRVTAETKIATRQRILDAAREIFSREGWEATTTRAIAARAAIASGTIFNYFPSKEALAGELLRQALASASDRYRSQRRGDESLEEDLFACVWSGLRQLESFRTNLGPVLPWLLAPGAATDDPSLRAPQLTMLREIAARHGVAHALTLVLEQLYWTLYLGVIAQWAADESPHQEDTLALLDQSLILFCSALNQSSSVQG